MTFEENLKTLEALVSKMESGGLNLDEMIKAFEEGRKLADACSKDLESIRLRIEKVTKTGAVEVTKTDSVEEMKTGAVEEMKTGAVEVTKTDSVEVAKTGAVEETKA